MPDICKRPFCDKCLIYHNGRCIPDYKIGWCYSCGRFHGEFDKGEELMDYFELAKPEPEPESELEEDDLEDDDQEDDNEDDD